jgi:hypothetical protein
MLWQTLQSPSRKSQMIGKTTIRRAWANRNLKHYGEAVADYTALI